MDLMLSYCHKIKNLDLSSFYTKNVTNMAGMFMCCYNLISINLSSFNTQNVTNMKEMFRFCKK